MGWTFVRQTRDQLIRELLAPQASEHACCEVIDHTLDGDVLWTVVRVTARQAGVMGLAAGESVCYIGCHLLESEGFTRCGIIHVEDGTPRIAYQRLSLTQSQQG